MKEPIKPEKDIRVEETIVFEKPNLTFILKAIDTLKQSYPNIPTDEVILTTLYYGYCFTFWVTKPNPDYYNQLNAYNKAMEAYNEFQQNAERKAQAIFKAKESAETKRIIKEKLRQQRIEQKNIVTVNDKKYMIIPMDDLNGKD